MEASRSLASTVELYADGAAGTCQVRADLATPYDGAVLANGAIFTVTAIGNSVDIQAFELSTSTTTTNENDTGPPVQIWAIKGTQFSSNPESWIEVASTKVVPSPDEVGAVVPRVQIKNPLSLSPGDEWTILVSFGDAKVLKMKDTTQNVGTVHQEDDFLKVTVGSSIGPGEDPFSAATTASVTFQGKLHYSVLKDCNSMTTITKFPFPFATESGADQDALKTALSDAFAQLLQEEASLLRWTQVYGLGFDRVNLETQGDSESSCQQHGFETGCDLYTSDIWFGHHESLNDRELILDMLLILQFRQGLGDLMDDSDLKVVYTGSDPLGEDFDISLMGLESGTILNPVQRDYLAGVVYNFLEMNSDVQPYGVDVSQTVRRLLRSRALEEQLNTVATIHGVGEKTELFSKEIKAAFLSHNDLFLHEIQRRQYLPGLINDRLDLGAIFADVIDVKVQPQTVPVQTGSGSGGGESGGMSKAQIRIMSCSITLALASLFLVYRFLKDFVLVERGFQVEVKKLSDQTEDSNGTTTRPELENMDKPRQRPSTKIDIGSLAGIEDRSRITSLPNSDDMSRSSRTHRSHMHTNHDGVRRINSAVVELPGARKKNGESDDDKSELSSRSNRSALDGSNRFQRTPSKDVDVSGVNSPHADGRAAHNNYSENDDDKSELSTRSNRSTQDFSSRSQRTKGAVVDGHDAQISSSSVKPKKRIRFGPEKVPKSVGSLAPVQEKKSASTLAHSSDPNLTNSANDDTAGGSKLKPKGKQRAKKVNKINGSSLAKPSETKGAAGATKKSPTKRSRKTGESALVKKKEKEKPAPSGMKKSAKPTSEKGAHGNKLAKKTSPNRVDMTGATSQ